MKKSGNKSNALWPSGFNKVIFLTLRLRTLLALVLLYVSCHSMANIIIKTPIIQGGMIIGTTHPKHTVVYEGKSLPLTPDGTFVFGIDRDAPDTLKLEETFTNGKTQTYTFNVKQREYQIQRITGVAKEQVTPPESALKRISDEAALVNAARQAFTLYEHFRMRFIWPAKGRISGVYGSQRFYNGEPKRPHYGIDIAAPEGTMVVAPADGVVTLTHPDMYFSGGTLIIDHGYGISSTFIHLQSTLVKTGDFVKQGDPIATIGSTGRSTGPHLDWRMNWYDVRLDPELILPPMEANK